MYQNQQYVNMVKNFNKRFGKRHDHKSTRLQNMWNECKTVDGESTLTNYLMSQTKHDTLYEALDIMNYNQYVKNIDKKPVEVKKPTKVKSVNVPLFEKQTEAKNMSLGLLEQTLANVIADKYVPVIADQVKGKVDAYVKENYGTVDKKITFTYAGNKLEETTHNKFATIFQFVLADEPVMLVGPAGSGKNHIVKQIAKLAKLPFYFTNAVTQEFKLTGFIDAMGKYHPTEFYKAFKDGGIFMLDEIDASIPEVLIILNAAISNRYFDFPNGRINAHPDFRIIAAGNTWGHGASMEYVGRNQLDGASLNRFAIIEIDYCYKIENAITNNTELLEFIRDFRDAIKYAKIHHIVSYREIIRCDKMLQSELTDAEVFQICLFKNLEKDDLKIIYNSLNDTGNKYLKILKQRIK